jgi:hypothetical protein
MIDINKLELDDLECLAAALSLMATRLPRDLRFSRFQNTLNRATSALFEVTYSYKQLVLTLNRIETPEQRDKRMYFETER